MVADAVATAEAVAGAEVTAAEVVVAAVADAAAAEVTAATGSFVSPLFFARYCKREGAASVARR